MNAYKSRDFDAFDAPPSGVEGVSLFLAAAGRALGHRSDANLARMLGVPPTTLASWKRRGSLPEEQWAWFSTRLVARIAARPDLPQVSRTARAAVVEILIRTGGNPTGVERFPVITTAQALGGLLALAELFTEVEGVHPAMLDSRHVGRVADALEKAMPQFRSGAEFVVQDLSQ